jgi:hypothetical protein
VSIYSDQNSSRNHDLAVKKAKLNLRVLCDKQFTPYDKLAFSVLLLKFHNTRNQKCNPSRETWAEAAGLSICTLKKSIKRLQASGVLRAHQVGRNSNQYSFDWSWRYAGDTTEEVLKHTASGMSEHAWRYAPASLGGMRGIPQTMYRTNERTNEINSSYSDEDEGKKEIRRASAPEGSLRNGKGAGSHSHSKELCSAPPDPAFEQFFNAHPRPMNEQSAFRMWKIAITKKSPKYLIERVTAYADYCARKTPKFIWYPDVWLEHEHWTDNYEASLHMATKIARANQRRLEQERAEQQQQADLCPECNQPLQPNESGPYCQACATEIYNSEMERFAQLAQ